MTMVGNPSWYDLLGLERSASPAEIRSAWKAAIADLDPTDRRFGVYNQAAEVLLDRKRRAAYDAELARQSEPETATPADPATADGDRSEASAEDGSGVVATAGRRTVPAWLLAVVGLLAAAAVVAAAVLWVKVPSDASVEQSTREAQAAAERAVGPILSYDYRRLDEDQQAADSYLTASYRRQYDKLFAVIQQNAPGVQAVVKGDVVASGIVRSGDDRVDVLLFVNQSKTNKQQKQPVVYKDQVTVTMQRVGGDWLVDDMVSSPVSN